MIGQARIGSNMVRRLVKVEHHCVVYDGHQEAVQVLAKDGATAAASFEDFAK
jgi:6-phosphogluconate dehydrogenase